MNVAESYKILHLKQGAGLAEVKTAFRALAFKLHPDLNPDNPHAARQFQRLNEAYVLLKEVLKDEPEGAAADRAKAKAEADAKAKASREAGSRRYREQAGKAAQGKAKAKTRAKAAQEKKFSFSYKTEDVLKDILSDPFARKVYEDIYSEIKRSGGTPRPGTASVRKRTLKLRWGEKEVGLDLSKGMSKGVLGTVKGWLRGQLDDEQTLYLEASQLMPGTIIRLSISRPWSGKPMTIQVPLPADYAMGRSIRLKGLGRRIGPVKGDLYLRLLAK